MAAVHSTHLSTAHTFSKTYVPTGITLVPNHGVQNDVHSGVTTQHQSAPSRTSSSNLRQVHLIPHELLTEISTTNRIAIAPGQLGENITTYGIDLLRLSSGSYLYFGSGNDAPVVKVTGTRWPGQGVERFRKGLGEVLVKGRKGVGVMGVVVRGGVVKGGDGIRVVEPEGRVELGVV